MFFSIVVPIYKVEKYLGECIDSILSQTFTDFELILVDDGSPDSSGEICEAYKAKDTRVCVLHKQNGGLSEARNFGTRVASGKYLVYIDSDDYLSTNDFLEKLYEAAQEEPDIILYKYKKYFEGSKEFTEVGFHLPNISPSENKAEVIERLVATDAFYCAAWMKAIRRSLIAENDIEFKTGILSEDQEWYYHVLLAADRITAIDEAFIVYRQRAGSITATTGTKNIVDNVAILKYWYDRISSASISDIEKNAILNSLGKLYANLLIAYATLHTEDKRKHASDMKGLSGLLDYDLNPRTKKMRILYRVLGFYGTVQLLAIIHKLRRR